MLFTIDDEAQVSRCQQILERRLHKILPRRVFHNFGHLGLSYKKKEVLTDGDLWYFGQLSGEPSPNRYWNAFGFLYSSHQPANIVVEINFPLQGVNRRISGVFAQDLGDRKTIILHRGGIGGGRFGIGKRAFLDWVSQRSPGRLVEFNDHQRNPMQAILVAGL